MNSTPSQKHPANLDSAKSHLTKLRLSAPNAKLSVHPMAGGERRLLSNRNSTSENSASTPMLAEQARPVIFNFI
jgi:hypothetical protein